MIYLDNAATTKVDKAVVREMNKYHTDKYGNASSQHHLGQEAKRALEKARKIIAKAINARPKEIIFTSGGTESNNLALKGPAFRDEKKTKKKRHLIVSKIEHDCVLNAAKWLKEKGWEVTFLDVDKKGFVSKEKLKKAIKKDTFLVSVIHGNNEIGTIQNLKELSKVIKDKNENILFHTDACQSFTKTELDVKKQNLDLVTLNGHKIHGPKGVGALYIKNGIKITPLQHGGGHESNKRSGTENIPEIVGFAKAVKTARKKHNKKMEKLRDKLIRGLEKIPESRLNGPKKKRLCNNVNFIFQGVEGEAIGGLLDSEGIQSSTGSACSSNTLKPSHVLMAIGLSRQEAHGSIRLSLSRNNTEEEIDKVIKIMPKIIKKLRKISPFEKIVEKIEGK